MFNPRKYNKYDKGRFKKPLSRKIKAYEERIRESKIEATRDRVSKWIDAIVGVNSDETHRATQENDHNDWVDINEDVEAQSDNSGGGCDSIAKGCNSSDCSIYLEASTGEEQKLNTAFQGSDCVQSPVKCDISVNNLIPNRLRERKPSGLIPSVHNSLNHIKELTATVTAEQTTERNAHYVTPVNSVISCEVDSVSKYSKDLIRHSCNREDHTEKIKKMETRYKCPPPIDIATFEKQSNTEKMGNIISTMNGLCQKMSEIDTQNNHETDGIQVNQDKSAKELAKAIKENGILKGLVQRQFCQIRDLNEKVAHLTAKSMDQNLTISGLEGDKPKEACKDNVITFFKSEVEIDAEHNEILVAHRLGKYSKQQKRPRLMVVKCSYELKERVLNNASNLKEKANSAGEAFYINKQLPEKVMEQNREIRQTVKELKEQEDGLPVRDRSRIEVRSKTVFVNGEPKEKELLPPEPMDLFPDDHELEKIQKMKLSSSDVTTEKGSDFQAFAIKTNNIAEVQRAYRKVRSLHAGATHVVAAFNMKSKSGYQDDDEHGAGHKLLKKIKDMKKINVSVFVTRYFGGTKLGPHRFDVMKDVAAQAIGRIGK